MRTTQLNKLNARGLQKLEPGVHNDGGGLYLKVKEGKRGLISCNWIFKYSFAGKRREAGLGTLQDVSPARAREAAAEARATVAAGEDPIAKRREALEAVAPIPVKAVPTFGRCLDDYVRDRRSTWKSHKHALQWVSSVENHASDLMTMPVDRVDVNAVLAALKPIWLNKPETARRVRQRIERVMGAAIFQGLHPGPNPAAYKDALETVLPSQKRIRVKSHAAVPLDEAQQAFAALWAKRAEGAGYTALITTIFGALRSGETRRLEWGDVYLADSDFACPTLRIPAERMKASRDHVVPITFSLAIWLRMQPRWGDSELIHSGRSGRPMSDMTMLQAMRRSGLEAYTVHGWRTVFRTWCQRNSVSYDLAEHALAHDVGSAVERAYARDTMVEQRAPVMAAWQGWLMEGVQ